MQFQVTNISGGVNVDTATVAMQEVRPDNPDGSATPTPTPISIVQLVIPLTEAKKYAVGDQYELTFEEVTKKAARK